MPEIIDDQQKISPAGNRWRKIIPVLFVLTAGIILFKHGLKPPPKDEAPVSNNADSKNLSRCGDKSQVKFAVSPIDLNDLAAIFPMGRMDPGSGHVTPTDHQYWLPNGITKDSTLESDPTRYQIKAPANGTVVNIEHQTEALTGSMKVNDYRVVIDYPCQIHSAFMHVNTLSSAIDKEFKTNVKSSGEGREYASVNLPIGEGEAIGTTGTHNFDFMAWDDSVSLPGFVAPERYDSENWKPHILDPFDLFDEPLKSRLAAKSLRKVKPFGGKIDYDIDGKLAGTWFAEGSGGYSGNIAGGAVGNYWDGHLSIAYDPINPEYVIISSGKAGLFAVKGNSPDPKNIDKSSGMIKYELISFDWITSDGRKWDFSGPSYDRVSIRMYDNVNSVALFQILDNRQLKVEFFTGKTAGQINGFDNKALVYER